MRRSADWLNQAQRDLAQARASTEQGFYDWACFAAQQAAEKAVKAAFQGAGAEAWGHSVTELLEALGDLHHVPDTLVEGAKELDKDYVGARYPDALPSGSPALLYTRAEAERSVGHATAIVEFCQGLLSAL